MLGLGIAGEGEMEPGREKLISRGIRQSIQMKKTPTCCSFPKDDTLLTPRSEGLGVRRAISPLWSVLPMPLTENRVECFPA